MRGIAFSQARRDPQKKKGGGHGGGEGRRAALFFTQHQTAEPHRVRLQFTGSGIASRREKLSGHCLCCGRGVVEGHLVTGLPEDFQKLNSQFIGGCLRVRVAKIPHKVRYVDVAELVDPEIKLYVRRRHEESSRETYNLIHHHRWVVLNNRLTKRSNIQGRLGCAAPSRRYLQAGVQKTLSTCPL